MNSTEKVDNNEANRLHSHEYTCCFLNIEYEIREVDPCEFANKKFLTSLIWIIN